MEGLCFATEKLLITGDSAVESLKRSLVNEGRELITNVLDDEFVPQAYEQGFHLLRNVGMYRAACRRLLMNSAKVRLISDLKENAVLFQEACETHGRPMPAIIMY